MTPQVPHELIGKVRSQGAFKDKDGKPILFAFIITEEGASKNANFSIAPGGSVIDAYWETKERFLPAPSTIAKLVLEFNNILVEAARLTNQ